MDRKTAIITGASSGIGRSLAIEMAKKGYNIVIAARRLEKLNEVKKLIEKKYSVEVVVCCCNVQNTSDVKNILIKTAAENFGWIDVVIANAGTTVRGLFSDLNISDYKILFDTNFFGVLNLIHAAYPLLKMSNGIVVIIGSVLGEIGIMNRSAYVAAKFALKGFYESVRYEFKEDGISTILIQAGFVNTELRSNTEKRSHSLSIDTDKIATKIVR